MDENEKRLQMQVRNKNTFDAIQLTHNNYAEFKQFMEEKSWSISSMHSSMNKIWCYLSDTVDPVYIHECDYVIFKDCSIVEIINADDFAEKYEKGENNMYTLQDFLNTLNNAGTLIRVTMNGNEVYKGKQIGISDLHCFDEFSGYHVWRLDIFEEKYLWVDLSK